MALCEAASMERVRGAKISMLEDVGHSPTVEAPTKTLRLIEEFLQ
jgi:pimeloyl-ACP methyl ester carboxylesterase